MVLKTIVLEWTWKALHTTFSRINYEFKGRNLNADDLIHRGSFGEETDKKASAFHESDSTSAHDEFSGLFSGRHNQNLQYLRPF